MTDELRARVGEIRDTLRGLEHNDCGDVVDLDIAVVEEWAEWLDAILSPEGDESDG